MNKITRKTAKDYGIDFDDLIDEFTEHSYEEHRKGSDFYTRSIVEINKKWFPDIPREFDGFWETNMYISNANHGHDSDEITELNRVQQRERTIVETYWHRVEPENK